MNQPPSLELRGKPVTVHLVSWSKESHPLGEWAQVTLTFRDPEGNEIDRSYIAIDRLHGERVPKSF